MGAWQDKNESLAGQKWEAWQKTTCKTSTFCQFFCHICLFSATSDCSLPYFPVFHPFLPVFQQFMCHFFPWAELFCRIAWQSSLAGQNWGTWPPLLGKNFGRKGLIIGRTEWLAPPENDPATPMVTKDQCSSPPFIFF